ncbi:MAG: pepsin/retropepsin-like aspartic protease family protein [Brevundimonas sp.]|uniref:pepsin/retropepsin-like aspartic protease family protein n=1 Tax=Brevundimonas sp. TaxID=1871086 RepID=UPI00271B8C69|nr:pepsin/retropepsin-like aspartic protease family protein [Brevundimonas sp.]MDO9588833.1 pepsin/retropepsin-like aspartic protease family protein [Brevundimonas sp.]MDP3368791.1 pepsin/retropepsin-like aspartic protease family protein [Brevundimonas sp.]MDP3655559.1 pepsin/retropepsin-like aspartic protease family protein [Brevundimonas sp.]
MNRRALLIRAAGLAAIVGGAWWTRDHLLWPRPTLTFADGAGTPWLAYARRATVPTVRVGIGGREVVALIDSGAQYSVIDRALVAALPPAGRSLFDMPLVAYGVGGGSQVGRGTALDLTLPGLTIGGLRAAILDLGPLASEGGLRTPLILGQDVLGEAVLALDPGRRYARLIRREAFLRPADLAPATVRRSGGALTTEVTVEGSAVEAVIDTGASALLGLSREAAAAAGLLDGRPQESGLSLVLGGSIRSAIVEARTVTFADHLYRRVPVGVFDQPPLPRFPGGLVGMEAFAGRRAALDLGAGALFVSRPLDLTVG